MLLQEPEYRKKLEEVLEQIKDSTTLAHIRGNDVGQFIYATNDFRSVEMSQSDEGIWIEFWNNFDENPVDEITVFDYIEAVEISIKWLNSYRNEES
jgi:hypothetical protein